MDAELRRDKIEARIDPDDEVFEYLNNRDDNGAPR